MPIHNTLNENMKYFADLNLYAIQILSKLSESVYSEKATVTVKIKNSNGQTFHYDIPSFYAQSRKMNLLDDDIKNLYNTRDLEQNKPIFTTLTVSEPDKIKNIEIPTDFNTKPNWIFEELLDPMLYITVDVSPYVDVKATQIIKRRIILSLDTEEKVIFFNETLKGKNDLNIQDLIILLEKMKIAISFDDNILDLPPIKLQFTGNFDIINIETNNIPHDKYEISYWYTLNSLEYTDVINTSKKTQILKIGDMLSTKIDTVYEVIDVDTDFNKVLLGFKHGSRAAEVGVSVLSIMSTLEGDKDFQIAVSANEQQIIFLKAVDPYNNTTTNDWGDGFAFDSNDLTIIDEVDGEISLLDFYNNKVRDFGRLFLGMSDDMLIHNKYAQMFKDAPTIVEADINVIAINDYIIEDTGTATADELADLLTQKKSNEDECKDINININIVMEALLDYSLSEADKVILQGDLNELLEKKEACNRLADSLNNEIITTYENNGAASSTDLKYRLFVPWTDDWLASLDIPESDTMLRLPGGEINPEIYDNIFYELRYRYLNKTKAFGSKILTVTNANNDNEDVNFNNWNLSNIYNHRDDNGNIMPNNIGTLPIQYNESIELQLRAVLEIPMSGIYRTPWTTPIEVNSSDYIDAINNQKIMLLSNLEKEYIKATIQRDYTIETSSIDTLQESVNDLNSKFLTLSANIIEHVNDVITLTAEMITNKEFFVTRYPASPDQVLVFPEGAPKGLADEDYAIQGAKITWNGYTYDGILAVGDDINVVYTSVKII